jgi:citrate synthase
MADETVAFKPGLEGVVGAITHIAEVDGAHGVLTLRGYDISQLAGKADAEEVAFLLWNGKLPNRTEFNALRADIETGLQLPGTVIDALKVACREADGMHAMRIGASLLSIGDPDVDNLAIEPNRRRAARLYAQMGAVFAHTWRIKQGKPLMEPKGGSSLAEAILYMQRGESPSQAEVDGLNAYMVAVAEHGLNVSTFASRVTVSTDSDMVSGLTSAVGALKGPKHGGVPGPVLEMLTKIGTPDKTEQFIRDEMGAGRRIMGFGHRIYKVRDPRAAILGVAAERMAKVSGDSKLLDLTVSVEQQTVKVLAELKPGRDLYANVELYAALILHAVNVPSSMFTPMFAVARTAGWTAHMLEQLSDNRIIRPDSIYDGPRGLTFIPIDERE